MALTVEDGTGKADADAYDSLVNVDAYHLKRGNETWTDADDAEKEAAIVRATFALDAKYGTTFVGAKRLSTQALQWPRIKEKDSTDGVKDADGYEVAISVVPPVISRVVAEIALIELTERFLSVGLTRDDLITSEKIGPLSTSWSKESPAVKQYPHIDAMLEASGLAGSASGVSLNIGLSEREEDQGVSTDPFDHAAYFHLVKYS